MEILFVTLKFYRKSTTSSENIPGSSSNVRLNGHGEVTDNREINRRNAVAKTKFTVKLFVNGNQVHCLIIARLYFTLIIV